MHARRRDDVNCFQTNLQHSRTETSNLGQLINQHNVDITYIQEPYPINNKLAGLPRAHKVYTSGDGRKRTAIVINNDQLDATLITQLSNEDCVAVEVRSEVVKFFSVSMYFDIHRDMEEDIRQLEKVMDYTKGNGLIIAADSNARSRMWHDTITNQRGKILEQFLICNGLYVMNEATETPTFQSNRGSSCIDLTIANSRLVRYVSDWTCGEEESCADHNIVNFKIASVNNGKGKMNYMGVRYITNQQDYKKFDTNLAANFISTFNCINKTDPNKLDEDHGVPQGSCNGSGFWNILYISLLNVDFTHRTRVIAFADDLLVLTRGKCTLDAENYANHDLQKTENWARENKMHFNENKSKVLLVTKKTSGDNRTLNIYLNNKHLEQVSEIKYLGIYFDNRFSFDRHVDYITGKCTPIINMLATSAKLKWIMGHQALKVIYSGAIEPILTYGAPIWEKALTKYNLRKYQRVQRKMNIKIAKTFRTLSYEASCLLAGVCPIRLAIEEKVRTYKATHNNIEYDAPLEVRY